MIGSEKGSVLLIVIAGITIIAAIGAGIATMRSSSGIQVTVMAPSLSIQAYYAAESGLEWAQYTITKEGTDCEKDKLNQKKTTDDVRLVQADFSIKEAKLVGNDCKVTATGWVGNQDSPLAKRESTSNFPIVGNNGGDNFLDFVIDENVFLYGSSLAFSGNKVEGADATIVIQEGMSTSDINQGADINVSNIFIGGDVILDRGSAGLGSQKNPGVIFIDGNVTFHGGQRNIYGDLYVNGDFDLRNAKIHNNVYVSGDVVLDWGAPQLSDNSYIYYTGSLVHPPYYNQSVLDRCIWVSSLENATGYDPTLKMPDYDIPAPKPDDWYADEGRDYLNIKSGILQDGLKVFANSDEGFTSTGGRTASDVIIVSKGDITLTDAGGRVLSGVLFAPYGKVTFRGNEFTGTVIARDGFDVTSGGTTVTFINIENFFDKPEDIPMSVE
jgi:hypothetical protein